MDLPVRSPQACCATTGRPFAPGEVLHSVLVRTADGLERLDLAAEAWTGPPDNAVAAWRSTYPAAGSAGPTLAPVDVLLDAIDELGDEPPEPAVRYLLALHLVRRRVLRTIDAPQPPPVDGELVLACRRREREYRVPAVASDLVASPEVAGRLAALLWSGEAA